MRHLSAVGREIKTVVFVEDGLYPGFEQWYFANRLTERSKTRERFSFSAGLVSQTDTCLLSELHFSMY